MRCVAARHCSRFYRLPAASAQAPADFYRGKTIEIYVNVSVGGGYDLYARMVARHLGKHIPGNPIVVPKNMEGGGGMRLANWLYNVAPKDGTALGAAGARHGVRAAARQQGARNTTASRFNYIGSANDEVSVCVAWHTSGIKTFEDAQKQATRGRRRAASSDDTYQYPAILNNMFGAKFKMVPGYPRRQRHQSRHGARRGAGALQHSVVDRQGDPQVLDRRE